MSNLKKATNDPVQYFEELPLTTQDIVQTLMQDTIDQVEGWKSDSDLFEKIECRRRDGFIPYSHNRGGLVACQFTDLINLWGSGTQVAHVKAQAEIERQIEYSLELAKESFFEEFETELKNLDIMDKTDTRLNYHDLHEMQQVQLAEKLSMTEHEHLSDGDSSIMFETRFMYHGQDEEGIHSASISCAVNTEGPYHRSSISWSPGTFCEGSKEVEIEWTTDEELQTKLSAALNKTSSEVF